MSREARPKLDDDDVGVFARAVTSARNQFAHAVKGLCSEHELGPRGPWIIGILGRASTSPHELADYFSVGRSLITAEVGKLVEAGLVEQVRNANDARRVTLSLSAEGRKIYEQLGRDLAAFLDSRLAGYTRKEIMLCARLLADFSQSPTAMDDI